MPEVALKGSVLPPGSAAKADCGNAPWNVEVSAISQGHEEDDCVFATCVFPDGWSKNLQLFLPIKPADLFHQIINQFSFRYGKNVTPVEAVPSAITAGMSIAFKEAE